MCPIVDPNFEGTTQAPDGVYRAKVKSVTQETSKSGNAYLKWVFAIIAPGEAWDNRWIYFNTTWSGKGAEKFRELVRAAIQPGYEKGPINTDDLIGKEIKIQIFNIVNQPYENVGTISAAEANFDSWDGDVK